MRSPHDSQASVLLVCPPGLTQVSLVTAVNAVPGARITAKTADVGAARDLAALLKPDIVLVDSDSISESIGSLFDGLRPLLPHLLCVVVLAGPSQSHRLRQLGADVVLDYADFNTGFRQVVGSVHSLNHDRSDFSNDVTVISSVSVVPCR